MINATKEQRNPISKNFEVGGKSIILEYKPSRFMTAFEKYIEDVPANSVLFKDLFKYNESSSNSIFTYDEYNHPSINDEIIKPNYKLISSAYIDLLKVLILLTDDSCLQAVLESARKKKDGYLYIGSRQILAISECLFTDCTYYVVSTKNILGNKITIEIKREKINEFVSEFDFNSKFAKDFLIEHSEIAQRMGL